MSNWGQGVGVQTGVEWSVVKPVTRGQTVPGAVLNPQLSNPRGHTACQTVPGQTGVKWALIKLVSDVGGQTGMNWSVVKQVAVVSGQTCQISHVATVKSAGVRQMSDAPRSNGGLWSVVKRVSGGRGSNGWHTVPVGTSDQPLVSDGSRGRALPAAVKPSALTRCQMVTGQSVTNGRWPNVPLQGHTLSWECWTLK